MKRIILILILVVTVKVVSQTTSNITYDAGSSVEVQTGADICATNIYINGSWSGGGSICGGALPVSLSSFLFTINKRDVTLIWVTEWEVNNSGFNIERSLGSEQIWHEIGFVQGTGTSNVQNTYNFTERKLKTGKYKYRLKQVDYNGTYEYYLLNSDVSIDPPNKFDVSQNYPNPSNPKSKINFELPIDAVVTIKVYDLIGREVATLINERKPADYYTIEFDGTNLASGVYFYRLIAEGNGQRLTAIKKLVLIK